MPDAPPPAPTNLLATVAKWTGFAGLMAVGFYRLVVFNDFQNGVVLISAGLSIGGVAQSLFSIRQHAAAVEVQQASIKDDLTDIRNTPGLPGTPTAPPPPPPSSPPRGPTP